MLGIAPTGLVFLDVLARAFIKGQVFGRGDALRRSHGAPVFDRVYALLDELSEFVCELSRSGKAHTGQ